MAASEVSTAPRCPPRLSRSRLIPLRFSAVDEYVDARVIGIPARGAEVSTDMQHLLDVSILEVPFHEKIHVVAHGVGGVHVRHDDQAPRRHEAVKEASQQ